MATRGPHGVDGAVARWRRRFLAPDGRVWAVRADDLDELCDHFRTALECRLRRGDTLPRASAAAAQQIGSPEHLIAQMVRARRPPAFYRRWCALLAGYAVLHASAILTGSAGLAAAVYRIGNAPAAFPETYLVTAACVVVGFPIVWLVVRRFGLASPRTPAVEPKSLLRSVAPIGALAVVLYVGTIFGYYWGWWLRADGVAGSDPWGGAFWVVLFAAAGPVTALLVATGVRRWHPALRIIE